MNTHLTNNEAIEAVNHWIDVMVIGVNLCPFARSAWRRGLVSVVSTKHTDTEACLQILSDEAHRLDRADPEATTLVVLTHGFADFDDYLDLLAMGQALLDDLGFDGILQLASFHPDYQFEGTQVDDVSNWTNRAPFPILHLLKEESVSRAVAAHADPEGIPASNIAKLEELGLEAVKSLMQRPSR